MKIKNLTFKNYLIIILFSFIFLIIDQTTKLIAVNALQYEYNAVNVLPFFSFALVYNTGVSFSLFSDLNYYILSLISFLAMLLSIYILIGMFKKVSVIFYLATSFLIAGSLGNLLDRIRLSAVIDFLYVHYGWFSFPVFNVADIFITCCAIIIIYKILFTKTA